MCIELRHQGTSRIPNTKWPNELLTQSCRCERFSTSHAVGSCNQRHILNVGSLSYNAKRYTNDVILSSILSKSSLHQSSGSKNYKSPCHLLTNFLPLFEFSVDTSKSHGTRSKYKRNTEWIK